MSTAIDSNVLIALWNEDDTLNTQARSALDNAFVAAPVFAQLLAAPSRSEAFLDSFIPSAKKRVLRWIGISMKPFGAPPGVPSSSMCRSRHLLQGIILERSRTENPADSAARANRWSPQTKVLLDGRCPHHTKDAASCRPSAARKEC
jgi:hypothetical protein